MDSVENAVKSVKDVGRYARGKDDGTGYRYSRGMWDKGFRKG